MIYYKSGYKYQLTRDCGFKTSVFPWRRIVLGDYLELAPNGVLTIRKGYAWDGPSGLTIDTKTGMQGSLVHDALYEMMRAGVLDRRWRHQADKELRRICREDGMLWVRAWYWYRAVRLAAAPFTNPLNRKPVQRAP
jgi:hypothetical protein